MKKLKKVFLVCLFSFLCFGFTKVSAETFIFEYSDSVSDVNLIMKYLEDYNLSSDFITEQCNSLHSSYGNKKYYACRLYTYNYLQNGIQYKKLGINLYTWDNTNKFDSVSFAYDKSYSTYWVYINSSNKDSTMSRYDFVYNNTSNSFDYLSTQTNNGTLSVQAKKSGSILKGGFNLSNLVYTNIDYLDNSSWPIIDKNSKYYNSFNLVINNETFGVSSNPNLPFYMFNTTTFNEWLGISYNKEPTYTYTSNVLENGNVELTFTFKDYDDSDSPYAFTIENEVSGEEYGEENPFSSIFPKVIPYGNSYTITIPYDTYLYITLAKYNQLENSSLYSREEIFTDVIDINNIVFANPSTPYYSIDYQSQTFIQGKFHNTQKKDTCYVKFSNDLTTRQVSCTNSFSVDFDFNGYLTFYVKRKNEIIYTRNVNVLGNATTDYPYLTYNIQKQDFYSVITFNVVNDNYDINMSYRYSLDNGTTWTEYQLIDKNPPTYNINIFSNSNVIFEIVDSRDLDNIVVYDSKSVYVVIDISTASGLNTSTDNIIDKFISLISLNDNLINYINLSWNSIKNSKLFLPIMIPFISSIICAIIYLIRRK